ncbi:ChrR family anti-sigma-E factor [Psychromonas sp. 14N.309.X.WAT.B.A12]|uniref:ChrR family anti-sigma-E factor n=1 Tax=unclassified Psychromonas TaxID=2614957 RepID=UPI0025B1639C|nr:ChrR family anti-sigma-E factor [Psychromonas sp. 14N.309.X.WAT.B.A12]MDN2662224.1 ChrR family anti-sigma-E factor [Psychromonas sp. 14N.309.X.WAT.B.A12]
MIKHHPKFELLQSYVNGDLPASLAIGISIHADMCTDCQHTIAQLTEQVAEHSFEEATVRLDDLDSNSFTSYSEEADEEDFFESMISNITFSDDADVITEALQREVIFRDKTYQLPTALSRIELGKAANIGKLSRSRLQLDEDEIHSSLLHINPGGGVPAHTHKGFELTVLLDGSFTDSRGEYNKGDFILLDGTFTHNPISQNGCLCYTVANDALHFTQGINKLLNPIGSFIY